MKKLSLAFLVIAILALVAVSACGGNGNTEESTTSQPAQTTIETTTEAETTSEPSGNGGGGFTWNDMPIYGGADEIHEFNISIPPAEGEYSRVEWRYYETGDDVEDVIAFYKDKMPDNGWNQLDMMGWMETQGMAWGIYMKNNEADAAMIYIVSDNGKTQIGLWRASE